MNTDFVDDKLPELAAAALTHQPGPQRVLAGIQLDGARLRAQLAGTVVEVAPEGADYPAVAQVVVLEAMKMQHVLAAPDALRTVRVRVKTSSGSPVPTTWPGVTSTRTVRSASGCW
ncbi:hypothetical protein MAHJHV29_49790 [Mycobacterium avium subsp. hominissuis]